MPMMSLLPQGIDSRQSRDQCETKITKKRGERERRQHSKRASGVRDCVVVVVVVVSVEEKRENEILNSKGHVMHCE